MRVLLFSGGIDSTAIAYWQRPERLLFIDYGQISAPGELRAARKIASELRIDFETKSVDCHSLGSGDLAQKPSLSSSATEFWPYRNQLLVTLAAMALSAISPLTIVIGTVKTDKIHPDGTKSFLRSMASVLKKQSDVTLLAPAINLSSKQLLEVSGIPPEILAWTFSCHRAEYACGLCRGCRKHFDTMALLR